MLKARFPTVKPSIDGYDADERASRFLAIISIERRYRILFRSICWCGKFLERDVKTRQQRQCAIFAGHWHSQYYADLGRSNDIGGTVKGA